MRILTTGVSSGLGKYIYERLGGIGLTREAYAKQFKKIKAKKFDVIIHCAFNSKSVINSGNLSGYLEDNIILTKELVNLAHKKFIYLSSVDVYPKNNATHSERDVIDLDSVNGLYAITKLMSEAIVKRYCENYLILRSAALLGKYSRKNSLIKIMENAGCSLTLSGDSEFNYILHSDVLDFLSLAIKRNLIGTYNVASAANITLKEAAKMLNKKVRFGNYRYDTGKINNQKAASKFSAFRRTSGEKVLQFILERR